MGPAFFVSEFSAKILSILIKRCFGSDFDDISKKPQLQTIIAQLDKQGAKTIVCEREYIDNDYFDDFANYYVHSFKDYRGSCVRMHFFSNEFEQEDLKRILKEMNALDMETQSILDAHYLGFIVIRPLPFTFLAKACIKSQLNTLTRRYRVSLFGIRLNIDSIGFQEQDRVVSACATTAVWSLLHALPEIHNKFIPSPSAITLNSFGPLQQNINTFPIKGLNLTQITATLESLRLRQHSYPILKFNEEEKDYLDKFSQFYLDSKIPIFMGAQIFKCREKNELVNAPAKDNQRCDFRGDHAIVVIGRIIRDGKLNLIIHDDRYGPFLQIQLVHLKPLKNRDFIRLSDTPTGQFGFVIPDSNEILIPAAILVATFHKKRIGVRPIINTAFWLLKELKRKVEPQTKDPISPKDDLAQQDIQSKAPFITLFNEIEYHARLYECHELKADYFKHTPNHSVYELMTAHLPHFVWRLRFTFSGKDLMDLIFDATDTPNGNPYICQVTLNELYADFLLKELGEIAIALKEGKKFNHFHAIVNDTKANTFHIDVLRQMLPRATNYTDYLRNTYGDLVSPKYTRHYVDLPSISEGDKHNRHRFFSRFDAAQQNFRLSTFLKINSKTEAEASPKPVIWLIDEEGALVLGPDNGHPSLIGANPARIAGEIIIAEETPYTTCWINYQSGRYSKQYPSDEATKFLENACIRWQEFFPEINFEISKANFIEILKNRKTQANESITQTSPDTHNPPDSNSQR